MAAPCGSTASRPGSSRPTPTHWASGLPLRLYQVVISEGRDYVLIVGMVEASRASEYVPAFRHVAESFTRRSSHP